MRQPGVGLVCHYPRLAQVPALRHVSMLPQASVMAVAFRMVGPDGRALPYEAVHDGGREAAEACIIHGDQA
jgi:hypothetical protein